jgi:hypothetical protein
MRKFVCAAIFTLVAVTFVAAEEITVRIFKCDADKGCIVYKKTVKGKVDPDDKGTVIDLTKNAKIVFGKKDPDDKKKTIDGDEVKGGLKNEVFSDLGEKGVGGVLFIADAGDDKGKVTKLRVNAKKKAN